MISGTTYPFETHFYIILNQDVHTVFTKIREIEYFVFQHHIKKIMFFQHGNISSNRVTKNNLKIPCLKPLPGWCVWKMSPQNRIDNFLWKNEEISSFLWRKAIFVSVMADQIHRIFCDSLATQRLISLIPDRKKGPIWRIFSREIPWKRFLTKISVKPLTIMTTIFGLRLLH